MTRWIACFSLILLSACPAEDDPPPAPDSGVPNDARPADSGNGPPPWPVLRAHDDSEHAPDLSCLNGRMAPTGGEPTLVARPVVPFGAPPSVTIPGVPVRFFLGERAEAACEEPNCFVALADMEGVASAELPEGAWVVTEVPAIDGPDLERSLMRTLEFQWVAGDEETINTFSRATLAGFEQTLRRDNDPTLGILAGRILDCQGRALSGARLRWYDEGGREIDEGPIYFDGMVPPGLDVGATQTATDGRYAAILPTDAARVEVWGARDGMAERIACESLQVESDTLSVLVLQPTRADAPSVCD